MDDTADLQAQPAGSVAMNTAPAIPQIPETDARVLALFQFKETRTLEAASIATGFDVLTVRMAIDRLGAMGLLNLNG